MGPAPNVDSELKTDSVEAPDMKKLSAVLEVLRKYNLKETEELLKKEVCKFADVPTSSTSLNSGVSGALCIKTSEGDADSYEGAYMDLKNFVDSSLNPYKHELEMILYPVFVHVYLELVFNGHEAKALRIMKRFGKYQKPYYKEDLILLAMVKKRDQMNGNEFTDTFRSNQFVIKMSHDTHTALERYLKEKKQSVIEKIIKEHLHFEIYEEETRTKSEIHSVAGSAIGEATKLDNESKVYYGLLREPDYQVDEQEVEEDESKKKKRKKEKLFSKMSKIDPNAPTKNRIPFPEMKDNDKNEKIKALKDASKRVSLGVDSLPSICCYSLLNSDQSVICAEISDDSTVLAVGFANHQVRVWSLTTHKLEAMKSGRKLKDVDPEAEDVRFRIMDEKNAEASRVLYGHSGPVYGLSFSPDRSLLLSCSEDASIRLWSLLTWTCLVAYKGHLFPVWDVKFCPQGYYFASAGYDKTARLWATDHHQPLRILAGHFSDVDKVQFHPNSNYVATGSSDRTVRLWDCQTGDEVRLLTGHKAAIQALAFSAEGRFLASSGADNRLLLWDLANGHILADLASHTAPTHGLTFSRDGTVLALGSLDCTVKLWDFKKIVQDIEAESNPAIKSSSEAYLLRTYATKNSPLISLQFSRRNVLLAVATFDSSM